jgi:hypothetical protein
MKNVLVLTAVLCFVASVSQASILEAWVTTDNPAPTIGQNFTVSIWLEVVPDPSLGETYATLASWGGGGVASAAVSVYQQNPQGYYAVNAHAVAPPTYASPKNQTFANCTFNTTVWDGASAGNGWPNFIPASRTAHDGTYWYTGPGGVLTTDQSYPYNSYTGPGDFDALEATGVTAGDVANLGVGTPVLLCTESWTCLVQGQAYLHVTMPYLPANEGGGPGNVYWNFDDPRQNGSYTNYFSSYETGSLVGGVFTPGTDLLIGVPAPEPATLALLGFGAVATLLRRRNKK